MVLVPLKREVWDGLPCCVSFGFLELFFWCIVGIGYRFLAPFFASPYKTRPLHCPSDIWFAPKISWEYIIFCQGEQRCYHYDKSPQPHHRHSVSSSSELTERSNDVTRAQHNDL